MLFNSSDIPYELQPKLRMEHLTKSRLFDLYVEQQRSPQEIAELYRVSRQTIWKKIHKYQFPIRDQAQARQLALCRGKLTHGETVLQKQIWNETFFTRWSVPMAWVLGIIYTDGCLTDNGFNYLSISQKEPELLHKVLVLMESNASIHRTKNGKSYLHHIRFGDRSLFNQLTKYGVTPRKSLTLQFPKIPKKYCRHFIRGCWDGDGSVYFEYPCKIRASFVSGSYPFIKGVRDCLIQAGVKEKIIIHTENRSKNPSYMFRLYLQGCKKLYQYFYKGVPESQYLDRKYQKFVEYFGIQKNHYQIQGGIEQKSIKNHQEQKKIRRIFTAEQFAQLYQTYLDKNYS